MRQTTQKESPLESLRSRLSEFESRPFEQTCFKHPLFSAGLPKGVLIQVTGLARTEWAVQFLANNPEAVSGWVESELTILPTAMAQRNIDLKQILFFETGTHLDWTVCTLLRSGLFSIIVVTGADEDEKKLRRYQLLCEKARASVVLLTETSNPLSWPVKIKLEAFKENGFLKQRTTKSWRERP